MSRRGRPKSEVHALAMYRRGCRCELCRGANRDSMRRWRASQKSKSSAAAEEPAPSPPQLLEPALGDTKPQLDFTCEAGPIESALATELDALIGEPPFKKTLILLARYNARILDQIPRMDRVDLVSGIQSRLFNVFDRLRKVESAPGAGTWDISALMTPDAP